MCCLEELLRIQTLFLLKYWKYAANYHIESYSLSHFIPTMVKKCWTLLLPYYSAGTIALFLASKQYRARGGDPMYLTKWLTSYWLLIVSNKMLCTWCQLQTNCIDFPGPQRENWCSSILNISEANLIRQLQLLLVPRRVLEDPNCTDRLFTYLTWKILDRSLVSPYSIIVCNNDTGSSDMCNICMVEIHIYVHV